MAVEQWSEVLVVMRWGAVSVRNQRLSRGTFSKKRESQRSI